MKKFRVISSLAIMLLAIVGVGNLFAVPAPDRPVEVIQPDGTRLMIQYHGDDFFHYTTTVDGYNISKKDDGFYYYAELSSDYKFVPTSVKARNADQRSDVDRAVLSRVSKGVPAYVAQRLRSDRKMERIQAVPHSYDFGPVRPEGKMKYLVLLADFSNVQFTLPKSNFENMLNKEGYSFNGATGSIKEYYTQNSNGAFQPEYVVKGPYKVNLTSSQADKNTELFVKQLCDLAYADGVNFSEFTYADKTMPVNIIHAGVPDPIWPHMWYVDLQYGDAHVNKYCVSPEYDILEQIEMSGIGTFSHEFGHILGWPDFYDTNYAENGQSVAVDRYSLMDTGCYNNMSNTPPAFTAMEMYMQGWLEPKILEQSGDYTLEPLSEGSAYMINTQNNGEYYLLENRSGASSVWEKKLEEELGLSSTNLMVFHVDRSDNKIFTGYSIKAIDSWSLDPNSEVGINFVNAVSSHECFKVVRAERQANPAYWVYPGNSGVTEIRSGTNVDYKNWNGSLVGIDISNIARSGNNITFTATGEALGGIDLVVDAKLNSASVEWNEFSREFDSFRVVLKQYNNVIYSDYATTKNIEFSDLHGGGVIYKLEVTAYKGPNVIAYGEKTFKTSTETPLNINARQNDAIIDWSEYAVDGEFNVKLTKAGVEVKSLKTSEKNLYLEGLEKNTEYEIEVNTSKDSKIIKKIEKFNTLDSNFDYFYISEIKGVYTTEEEIPLCIRGGVENVASVIWKIDGEGATPPVVKLSSGKHVIEAIITDVKGEVNRVIKTITVN